MATTIAIVKISDTGAATINGVTPANVEQVIRGLERALEWARSQTSSPTPTGKNWTIGAAND